MLYTTGRDTEPKLVALLEAAQDEPVFIERGQQQVASSSQRVNTTASEAQPPASSSTSATPSPTKPRQKA